MTANNDLVCLADVEPLEVKWLWENYIPFGNITLLLGDPGIGKGTITADLVARVTKGIPMPNATTANDPLDVLLLTTAEDSLQCTVLPRLLAANAGTHRIHTPDENELVSIAANADKIREWIDQKQARLVVIDPLNAYLGKVDGHKDQEVRQALTPLKQIAEQTGAAILLVHHLNKTSGSNALYRAGGSIGIVASARSALLAGKHPTNGDLRVLAPVKSNLGIEPPALSYAIESDMDNRVGRVRWGGVVSVSSHSILACNSSQQGEGSTKREQAAELLRTLLADGERLQVEIEAEADEQGIGRTNVFAARKVLKIRSRKSKEGWWLSLPPDQTLEPLKRIERLGKSSTVQEYKGSRVQQSKSTRTVRPYTSHLHRTIGQG